MKPRLTGGFAHGAAIAVVCDLDDPEDMGRVRVWYPGMHDEVVSFWARIRASQAGDSRGNFIRPEIGDEVLVMFEQGSMNQPFVVGCLWNGSDGIPGPGNADGANDHKWLQTRSGHQLVFNDNAGGGWIEIHDGTQRLHTRIDVPEESITARADTGFIHVRAPKGTIRLECEDLNVHTRERCAVQVKNTHRETVSGSRTVTVVEQDVDTKAVERFSLSTPQMTTTAKKLVTTTGQTAVRMGSTTASVTPKLDMVLEGEVKRTIVDAKYEVGQLRTSHDGQPSGPLKWTGETLRIEARGSVRMASGKTLTLIGGTVEGKGGSVSYGADEKDGQGLGDASSIAFEGGMVALNGGAGPAFPVSKMGDTLMGNCNHTTGPAPPIPAGPIPLFPYMVANPISKDTVSSVKINGMAAAPAGATAIGAHIPPIPPPPWLPKPVNYRSSLVGAFNSTFKGPLSAAVSAAKSATDTVQGGESTKSVVTVEGEEKPTAERWHLRLPPLFGQVGAFTGKLSGVSPFPVAAGQINIACQGVQATDRPLGVTTLMHAHSCSDIVPPPNAMIMGGGTVVAGISASAMGQAAQWAADYEGKAYAGGAPLGHRAQRQVDPVEPGSDIVLANETNPLAPFPGFLEATAVGHPVDVGSGALFDRVVDFEWPGPVAWRWVRGYNSLAAGPAHGGRLGIGWRLAIEESLTRHFVTDDSGEAAVDEAGRPRFFWVLHTVDLRAVRLPPIAPGEAAALPGERLLFERPDGDHFCLTGAEGITRRFATHRAGRARLVAIEDGAGPRITIEWSAEGWPTLTDRAGHVVQMRPDDAGVTVWSLGHRGDGRMRRLVAYAFDARGRLASSDGVRGGRRYGYDPHDRMVDEAADGYRWAFAYDDAGRVLGTWGEDQRYAFFFEYLPAAQTTRVVDGLGRATAYRWDAQHRVVGFTAPDGTATLIERDDFGRIVGRVEPLDRSFGWSWDERGRLVERVDADGATRAWAHDRHGLTEAVDPGGATLRITRDAEGRARRVRAPDGRESLRRVDADGRLIAEEVAGRAAEARYDAAGWLVGLTVGAEALRVSVDGDGRPASIERAEGESVRFEVDDAGRCVGRDRSGRVERWVRGAGGRIEAHVDGDGHRWHLERDPLGRAVGWRAPSGVRLRSERGLDDRYRWHAVVPAPTEAREDTQPGAGATWRYGYDALGRLTAHAVDDGSRKRFVRDRAGRLRAIHGPGGPLLEIEPDPMGRPAAVRLATGGGWTIARDACGRALGATALVAARPFEQRVERRIEISLRRDAAGRVIEEAGPGGAVRARFGPRGLRSVTVDGVGLRIERDPEGRPTAVTAPDGAHRIDWRGARSTHITPAGLRLERSADGWRLSHRGGREVARYEARRAAGRLIGDRLVAPDGERWRRRFERDPSGRLRARYDTCDNRVDAGWRLGDGQRLLSDGDAVEHDALGRVLAFGEPRAALTWDGAGRLSRFDGPDGVGVQWLYDAFARPVEQWIRPPAAPLRRVTLGWWGDRLVAVDDGLRAVHLPLEAADGLPWGSWVDGRLWLWLADGRGAALGAVADDGATWWAPPVDGWGAALDGESPAPPVPGWVPGLSGMWRDAASGLCLNRFRWYRPAWGRYLSPDPLGVAGGHLRYGYAGNDPTRRVDPLGLSCADPQAAAPTAGVGPAPQSPSAGLPAPEGVTPPRMGADGPTELPLVPGTTPPLPFPLPGGDAARDAPPEQPLPADITAAARQVGEALGAPAGLMDAAAVALGLIGG